MALLTKEDLDEKPCSICGVKHWGRGADSADHSEELYLHAACHMAAPTWVMYKDGKLTITCSVCSKEIATVEIK